MTTERKITVAEFFCFYVITIAFIFFAFIVWKAYTTQFALPSEINQIVIVMVSVVSGVLGYMIGSTSSSKAKDTMINKALDSVPASVVTAASPEQPKVETPETPAQPQTP